MKQPPFRPAPACLDVGERLGLGDDINALDRAGETALTSAAKTGRLELIRALLAAGADPDLPNSSGKTALMMAAFARNGRECRELLSSVSNFEKQACFEGGLPSWGVCFLGSEALETYLPKDSSQMAACGWERGVGEALAQGRSDLAEEIKRRALEAIARSQAGVLSQEAAAGELDIKRLRL